MVRSFTLALTSVLAITALSTPSRAAGIDSNGWVGGFGGLHLPDAEDTSSRPAYGITGGVKLGTEWGIGAYYLTSSKEEDINGVKTDFDYSLVGVEIAYHFEGEAAGVHLGGRLGMTTLEVGSLDSKPVHLGLMAGYNHWLSDHLSIGGEAALFNVASSEDTVAGVKRDIEGFNALSLMASLRLWF